MNCIPCIGGAASVVGLATDIRVLVFVSEIEAKVVDDISGILNNVGALLKVAGSSLAAENLKLGHVVDVCSGGEAGKDTLAGKEEGAGADGEDSALTAGVLLLEFGKVVDEAEGLGLLLENFLRVASEDDENVKVLEAIVRLLEGDLGADHDTLFGKNLGFIGGNGDFKGLGSCRRGKASVRALLRIGESRHAGRAGAVSHAWGAEGLHSSLKS